MILFEQKGGQNRAEIVRFGNQKDFPELIQDGKNTYRQIQFSSVAAAYVVFNSYQHKVSGFRLMYIDREDKKLRVIKYPISLAGYQIALSICLKHFHNVFYNNINPYKDGKFVKG